MHQCWQLCKRELTEGSNDANAVAISTIGLDIIAANPGYTSQTSESDTERGVNKTRDKRRIPRPSNTAEATTAAFIDLQVRIVTLYIYNHKAYVLVSILVFYYILSRQLFRLPITVHKISQIALIFPVWPTNRSPLA